MTINIFSGAFEKVEGVDPGDGLDYRRYVATTPDNYNVSISGPSIEQGIGSYYVFDLPDLAWVEADTINAGMAGTFETGDGDDLLTNFVEGDVTPLVTTRFFAGGGQDTINGPSQVISYDQCYQNEAYGGSGDDLVYGGNFNDTLYGDKADGFTGDPVIASVTPAGGYDTQADGDDTLVALEGDDSIDAGGGDDQIFGGDGADTLVGGTGSDFLYGGKRGEGSLDLLTGGGDADAFVLSYSQDTSNAGAGFWSAYFDKAGEDIANNAAKTAIADAIKAGGEAIATGILAAGLGAAGGDLAGAFVGWVESLFASSLPKSDQDVMVVTDFDPREDVLILPLQPTALSGLTVNLVTAEQVPGGGTDDAWALEFVDASTVYAYVELGTDFLTAMGLDPAGDQAKQVLENLFAFSTQIQSVNGAVGFTNLVPAAISDAVTGGPFQPQQGDLPANSAVALYGAVGGIVIFSPDPGTYGSVLAGTNYSDALSTNTALFDPASGQGVLASTAAYIYGFGGADLIYGTDAADTLSGGDGDDALYSFVTTDTSGQGIDAESLTGGTGDDTLYGGGSGGSFDGGDGSDTFSVVYLEGYSQVLQVAIDLTKGMAAERAQPAGDTAAPISAEMPWGAAGEDTVANTYSLSGIENATGGALNDWIKATNGSVIEGGAGADYLDLSAGGVTLRYAGSAEGVSVQLYADMYAASGGDAEGDVLFFTGPTEIIALQGSAGNDTLGAFEGISSIADTYFEFTGNGGSDIFQLLGAVGVGVYVIIDFDNTAGEADRIDLRALGVTSMSQVTIEGIEIFINDAEGNALAFVEVPNFTGTVTAADFLLATAVSGGARAQPGGDGLVGGEDGDTLEGREGQDFLFGTGGNDSLLGRLGDDALDGGAGDDAIAGGFGRDRIVAGEGDDTARGAEDADWISGGAGDDSLEGGRGEDTLLGGQGTDSLFGGEQDDVIDGGAGADQLRGGLGADTFLLRLGESDGDVILGFARGAGDRLQVLADAPVSVVALGGGRFLLSDGVIEDIVTAKGALASDFLL